MARAVHNRSRHMRFNRRLPRPSGSFAPFAVAALLATMVGREPAGEGSLLHVVTNGLPSTQQVDGGQGMTALQAMMWKYVARCALPEGKELTAPAVPGQPPQKFPGLLGVAPEWYGGTCNQDCQQKVSSCLIALTNRTGKHVALSLLSAAASMSPALMPSDQDRDFPHQEGVFFGNVFSSEAFACHGRGAAKAAQVKRFCAVDPASCSGFAQFVDAGRCDDVCKMSCQKLSDGSERCAAVSCTDPKGRAWAFPITTYLRNQIEATNADALTDATPTDDGLTDLDGGDSATFKGVDFGATPGSVRTFAAAIAAPRAGGRIEVGLVGGKRLGTLKLKVGGREPKVQTATLDTAGVSGANDVVLTFAGGKKLGRLVSIEFR
jgi:hypothetical protein